jgi:predicted dehydrogenase
MRRVRTAIIGCGKVAHIHAAALRALPRSEFAAVCDCDAARAAAFGAQYDALAFTDVDAMFRDAAIEAAMVCTPHPLHAPHVLLAAECGIHVLVEKLLSASLADCDAMIDTARRAGVKLGVVSQRRLFEPVIRMKAAINEGKIGQPVLGRFSC